MPEFIVEHYLLLMILIAFIIFAIIGYIVDSTKNKKSDNDSTPTNQSEELEVSLAQTIEEPEIIVENVSEEEIPEAEEFVLTNESPQPDEIVNQTEDNK